MVETGSKWFKLVPSGWSWFQAVCRTSVVEYKISKCVLNGGTAGEKKCSYTRFLSHKVAETLKIYSKWVQNLAKVAFFENIVHAIFFLQQQRRFNFCLEPVAFRNLYLLSKNKNQYSKKIIGFLFVSFYETRSHIRYDKIKICRCLIFNILLINKFNYRKFNVQTLVRYNTIYLILSIKHK